MTTPPDNPDPWAPDPGRAPQWEQPPGPPPPPPPGGHWSQPPGGQPGPPPGWPAQQPPGWGTPPGAPPGSPPMPGTPVGPPPGWPQQGVPGDWSAPGYGYWGAPKRNGMGTAGLVLGILGLLSSPSVVFGIIFGLLGLIFGLVGRGRVKRREADNSGVATWGVVLGALALAASVLFIVLYVVVWTDAIQECIDGGHSRAYCEQNTEIGTE